MPLGRTSFASLVLLSSLFACAPAHGGPPKAPALGALAAASAHADSTKTTRRSVTPLAPGVYAIRHPDAPDTFPQGNTTVVVGDREALVVDSCYLPSSAREDIAQIKAWTGKPVRYLVNTHWHFDHTMGNVAYRDAFPGLAVVAQEETKARMAAYDPGWFERFPTREARFRAMLAKGAGDDGKPFSESEKQELREAASGVVTASAELVPLGKRAAELVPDVAFERSLDVDLGHRRVQVLFLGRGNTLGDAVVYLPDEKIVATGDLLDAPVPYLGGGYPVEEIATLRALAGLGAQTFVPGHGDVLHDGAYLGAVIELLETVVTAVDREIARAPSRKDAAAVKSAVLKSLDVAALRAKFAGTDHDDGDFFENFALAGAIDAAHAEMWPR
jgi:cyclase